MKRCGFIFLSALLALSFTIAAVQANPSARILPAEPSKVRSQAQPANPALPAPPSVEAKAYILIDINTGQTLAEMAADTPFAPASLTKLMTAYLTFEAIQSKKLKLDQLLSVSARAYNMTGSRMFVEQNALVSAEDLIKGMIVQSGNDATIVLAEAVGGSIENFVTLMNKKAQELGMTKTSFKNPEGLDTEGHFSTARDLATLSMNLMKDFPVEYAYYSIKVFSYQPKPDVKPIEQENRNRLLHIDPSVDGLKTGNTNSAGFCLIASAAREFPNLTEKRRLLSVLMGAESDNMRTQESQRLLNWGYQEWADIQLYDANATIKEAKVWKGKSRTVKIGVAHPVVISTPKGMANGLKATANFIEPLIAPLTVGQQIGVLTITIDTPSGSHVLSTHNLVITEDVPRAGFFGRLWDTIMLWFQ